MMKRTEFLALLEEVAAELYSYAADEAMAIRHGYEDGPAVYAEAYNAVVELLP
jgi:hypothetical protein